jgi:peptidyl-prolyl cis-trans isomerase A (cyclophilin A)/peptidyl-prolyl cis-trans isomerase B (cyclophilin B)
MSSLHRLSLSTLLLVAIMLAPVAHAANPVVRMTTSEGVIEIELYPDKAPVTVKNFLDYVKEGHYDGMVFHRVIKGFMIQGGGFLPRFVERSTRPPIVNEATNGLSNLTGTIAMARTWEPVSATDQFFINTADNKPLDHKDKSLRGWGYAVFGKVTKGMDVVRRIEAARVFQVGRYDNVPMEDIVIRKAELVPIKAGNAVK